MSCKIANMLLEIGAVTLRPDQPYLWASGIRSPIYCDNRIIISYPKVRNFVARRIVTLIRRCLPDVDVIAGTATGGIPHASWVAQKMGLPMIYVRSAEKKHGKENIIEGVLSPGSQTVVIEDLISTGESALKVVETIRNAGAKVLGIMAIFTFELLVAEKNFREKQVPYYALCNFSCLIKAALKHKYVNREQMESLKKWKASYDTLR